jgi:LacI family transcriptional regulator
MRGPVASSTAFEKLAAFHAAVKLFDLDPDPALVVQGNYLIEGGFKAAGDLLDLYIRPTAVIAANDLSAMGVFSAAAERGLIIPKDLSVIGWDDIQIASLPYVNLTTMHLPKRDMGAAAAILLMERIRKRRAVSSREVFLPIHLMIRGSTGPVIQFLSNASGVHSSNQVNLAAN